VTYCDIDCDKEIPALRSFAMSLREYVTQLDVRISELWYRVHHLQEDLNRMEIRQDGRTKRLARLERLHTPKCAACGAEQAIPEQHPAPALTWTLKDGEKAAASCCDQDCNRHPQSQNQSHTKEKTP